MISKLLMAIVLFLIFPELIGLLVVHFVKKEKYNLGLALVVGYLIEFGILEILSIITIIKVYSVISLVQKYMIISGILAGVSTIVNFTSTLEIIKELVKNIKETPKILAIVVILLIGVQVYFPVKYAHTDEDDSHYVGSAVTDLETNTLYRYASTTGQITIPHKKYIFSYFMSLYSVVSVLLNTHPAVAAHLVLPIVFIPLVYLAYFQVGKELFDRKKAWLFLLFMCILNIFGNVSVRTNFTFLLFRIWQGKALMANLILPLAILFMIAANKNEHKFMYYVLLFITSLGGVYTTSMAIGFVLITIMLLGLSFEMAEYKERSLIAHVRNLVIYLICCMPSLLAGLGYVLYK